MPLLHRHAAKLPLLALSVSLVFPSAHAQTNATAAPLTPAQITSQLDPQMASVLSVFNAFRGTPIIDLAPPDARQQASIQDAAKILARSFGYADAPMPVGKVEDGHIAISSDGHNIPLRIYIPSGTGPFPVIVYYHGGGFVIATIDTYDATPRALCNYANSIVVSVEYRKAPEAPFPGAREDALSSYLWVKDNIAGLNGIPSKIAVAGESAGGNLAIEVALQTRDQGLQQPTHQLLIYPVTSGNLNQTSDQLYTSSILPLNTPALEYFLKYYTTDPAAATDPAIAPINANLAKLPPTTIIAAQLDPLLSDGQAYAAKLKTAGSVVSYHLVPGVTHEFFGLGSVVDKAKAAEQYGAAQIAASFK